MSQQLGAGGRDQQEHPQLRGEGRPWRRALPSPTWPRGQLPAPSQASPSDL